MTQFLLRMSSKHMRTTRRSSAQLTSSSKSSMVTHQRSTWWAWQGWHGTCGIWRVTSWFNHFHLSLGHLFVDIKEKTESSCHMMLLLYRNSSSPLPGLVTFERKIIHTTLGWFFVEDFYSTIRSCSIQATKFLQSSVNACLNLVNSWEMYLWRIGLGDLWTLILEGYPQEQ